MPWKKLDLSEAITLKGGTAKRMPEADLDYPWVGIYVENDSKIDNLFVAIDADAQGNAGKEFRVEPLTYANIDSVVESFVSLILMGEATDEATVFLKAWKEYRPTDRPFAPSQPTPVAPGPTPGGSAADAAARAQALRKAGLPGGPPTAERKGRLSPQLHLDQGGG